MATNETNGISLRRLKTFLTNLKNIFAEKSHSHATSDITGLDTALSSKATSVQGNKADTAVQSVKIGTTEYKSGTTVTLPSYPTSLPANGGNASTVNGHTVNTDVPSGAKFTDTNTWRPLGTTADTACSGNDSRLSNARPASDVYAWAKASSKPSYSWSEITSKPTLGTASSKTVRTLSASGASGWKDLGTDQGCVPDMAFIAYWNGAYSGSSSNLAYCNKGAFGTAATANNGDFATASHTHSNYLTSINKTMVVNALGYTPPTVNTTYNVATQSSNGLFSASDKKKLDGITSGSNTIMKLISSTDYSRLTDAQKKNGTVYFVV